MAVAHHESSRETRKDTETEVWGYFDETPPHSLRHHTDHTSPLIHQLFAVIGLPSIITVKTQRTYSRPPTMITLSALPLAFFWTAVVCSLIRPTFSAQHCERLRQALHYDQSDAPTGKLDSFARERPPSNDSSFRRHKHCVSDIAEKNQWRRTR